MVQVYFDLKPNILTSFSSNTKTVYKLGEDTVQFSALWDSTSLASRLNGYMYSNGKSLNMALFILMANCSRVTLQLLGVKNIPCRVASLLNIFN